MLRIGFMLLIVAGISLTGCENSAKSAAQTASTTAAASSKDGPLSAEPAKVQLQENEPAYLRERFPKIASFTASQPFSKIQIQTGEHSREITDPAILQALEGLIVLKRTIDVGSPPVADLEPVHYLLTTTTDTYRATIVCQGLLTFDDLYPDIYFEVDNYASLPGRAFGIKPPYLANMPAMAKMIDSGLLRIEDPDAYYLYHAGRIRNLALAFYDAEKTPVARPPLTSKNPDWQATFYYYGDEIYLRLYNDSYLQLADGDDEQWFEAEKSVIQSFNAILSAG